jgi:filamentous hemagglutinin family protein
LQPSSKLASEMVLYTNHRPMIFLQQSPFSSRLLIASLGLVGWLTLLLPPVKAQVIPDATLPTNSSVPAGCSNCTIDGGTVLNGNLLHSFEQFSVPAGGQASFNNDPTILNIFSRVTGANPSNIDGLIKANGNTNLFLINPNGIVFGANASLNVGGSFVATSADSVLFGTGEAFSASSPQNLPGLTISVPVGLQFGANPGAVVNQSTHTAAIPTALGQAVGLSVPLGETLALVGGNVQLPGGNLTAPAGRIELGAAGSNQFVGLAPDGFGWQFAFDQTAQFGAIQMSGGAVLDTSSLVNNQLPAGPVNFSGQSISLTEGATVISVNGSSVAAAPIQFEATEVTSLQGGNTAVAPAAPSAIISVTIGPANAADINLVSPQLSLNQGGLLGSQAATSQGSRSGNINVSTSESIQIVGTLAGESPSGIFTLVPDRVNVNGNGGNIVISTPTLLIGDGGQISTSLFGNGNAGNLLIEDAQLIQVSGSATIQNVLSPSGIFSQVAEGGVGNAGNLTLETQQLEVLGGGQISNAIRNTGQGGTLTITAGESVLLSGTAPNATLETGSSGLFVSAEPAYENNAGNVVITSGNAGNLVVSTPQLTVENGARISADTFGTGNGGDVNLTVAQLQVLGGGQIRVGSLVEEETLFAGQRGDAGTLFINGAESITISGSGTLGTTVVPSALIAISESTGAAGNIDIQPGQALALLVSGGGRIDASTGPSSTEPGGNITIAAADVLLENNGQVSVSSQGQGQGGSIVITSPTITLRTSRIVADTLTSDGGNIELNAQTLLQLEDNSLISTTAGQAGAGGNGGNIIINVAEGFVIAVLTENSDITANAFEGDGGNITITAEGLFGLEEQPQLTPNSDITASSEFGFSGSILLQTPDGSALENNLVDLSGNVIDTEALTANSCIARSRGTTGTFVVTGSGGLMDRPGDVSRLSFSTGQVRSLPAATESDAVWKPGDPIEEPSGAFELPDGRLVLAQACD